ncbi:MAG: hypothetical protein ACPGWS_08555 [Solirubrobacterales bacterium]
MSAKEFQERYAHFIAFPYGDDAAMIGRVIAEIHNVGERLIGLKTKKHPQMADEETYVPYTNAVRDYWRKVREDALIEAKLKRADATIDAQLRGIAKV